MINLRSVLLFNFGLAIIFVLVGAVSVYTLDFMQPNRRAELVSFLPAVRAAIQSEQEVELLRAQAVFYYDTARDLRRARTSDAEQVFYDVRLFSFIVATMFLVSGLLALLLYRTVRRGDEAV